MRGCARTAGPSFRQIIAGQGASHSGLPHGLSVASTSGLVGSQAWPNPGKAYNAGSVTHTPRTQQSPARPRLSSMGQLPPSAWAGLAGRARARVQPVGTQRDRSKGVRIAGQACSRWSVRPAFGQPGRHQLTQALCMAPRPCAPKTCRHLNHPHCRPAAGRALAGRVDSSVGPVGVSGPARRQQHPANLNKRIPTSCPIAGPGANHQRRPLPLLIWSLSASDDRPAISEESGRKRAAVPPATSITLLRSCLAITH